MTFVYVNDFWYGYEIRTYEHMIGQMDFGSEWYQENGQICTKCKMWYPWNDFFKFKDGYTTKCKECLINDSLSNMFSAGIILDYGRECSLCREIRPWDEFSTRKTAINHKTTKCKSCRSFESTLRKVALSFEDYVELLVKQDFSCAICGQQETALHPRLNRTKALSIDHCHDTGIVRGLLCSSCNIGIGCFDENTELMKEAIEYLNCKKSTRFLSRFREIKSNNRRDYQLFYRYGINDIQYRLLFAYQGKKCAICSRDEAAKDSFSIDHIHGFIGIDSIRGILCEKCNLGIGCFLDDSWLIDSAIEYLRLHNIDNGSGYGV